MDSVFFPRFLTTLLRPVHSSIRSMTKGSDKVKDKICQIFLAIKEIHEQDTKYVYTVFQESKSFDLFAKLCDDLEEWIEKYEFKLAYQKAITMVSKAKGQVLRISALLNSFFLVWDKEEVYHFEMNSPYKGNFRIVNEFKELGNKENIVAVPVSVMAMECAISIVMHSLYQNLLIQGMDILKCNTSKPYITEGFFEVDKKSMPQPNSLVVTEKNSTKRSI